LALLAQHEDIGVRADAWERTVLPHIDRRYRQHGCAPPFRGAVMCIVGVIANVRAKTFTLACLGGKAKTMPRALNERLRKTGPTRAACSTL